MKGSSSTSKGSEPAASNPCATLRRPKRRGSTNLSSLPEAKPRNRVRVFLDYLIGLADQHPPSHAEMHDPLGCGLCAGGRLSPASFADLRRDFALTGEDARPPSSRSNTICFPTRRTPAIRLDSRAATISDAARFQRLGLRSKPHRLDDVARDPTGQATGDGFNFRKFRHETSLQASVPRALGFRLQDTVKPGARSLKPAPALPSLAHRVIITSTPLLRLYPCNSATCWFTAGNECVRPCIAAGAAALFVFHGVCI